MRSGSFCKCLYTLLPYQATTVYNHATEIGNSLLSVPLGIRCKSVLLGKVFNSTARALKFLDKLSTNPALATVQQINVNFAS